MGSSPKLIMFLAFMFLVGIVVSFTMSGSWFGESGDNTTAVLNSLTVIRSYNVMGLFSVPWLNPDFFTVGIPKVVNWDMGFFGGESQIIQYFFYVITIGFIFGILPIVIGVLQILRG